MPSQEPSDNPSSSSSPHKLELTHSNGQFPLFLLESSLCSANLVPTDDKNRSTSTNSLIAHFLNADGTLKRPINPFMIFLQKRRPEVSAANQTTRTGVTRKIEIKKTLRKEWNAMDIVSHISHTNSSPIGGCI